jgi:hypothetical protein
VSGAIDLIAERLGGQPPNSSIFETVPCLDSRIRPYAAFRTRRVRRPPHLYFLRSHVLELRVSLVDGPLGYLP